jgi:acyl carrier protein
MDKITELVYKIVKDLTQTHDLNINKSLLDEGVLDSLSTIELITKLEEIFNINIDSDDLNHENFNSIESIVTLIKKCGYSGSV